MYCYTLYIENMQRMVDIRQEIATDNIWWLFSQYRDVGQTVANITHALLLWLLTSTDTPRDASETVSIVQFHRDLSSDPRLCLRHCSTPYPAYCIVHAYCAPTVHHTNDPISSPITHSSFNHM